MLSHPSQHTQRNQFYRWLLSLYLSCRYELYSISKPATLDTYLAYPLLRYYQKTFREASIAAVKKALEKDETVDAAMRIRDTMKMG